MHEPDSTLEEAMLPEAAQTVIRLLASDRLDPSPLDPVATTQTDERWGEAAAKFPPFADRIAELRDRMRLVDEKRTSQPRIIATAVRMPFSRLSDEGAGRFLADVLASRSMASGERIDHKVVVGEFFEMCRELGFPEGTDNDHARSTTLQGAVNAVLRGSLQLTPQLSQVR